jgi:hypothetical protein
VTAVKLCLLIGVHLAGYLFPGSVLVALRQTATKLTPLRFSQRGARSEGKGGLEFRTAQLQHDGFGPPIWGLLKILLFSGVIAYESFFAYVLSPLLGRMYSIAIFSAAVGVVTFRPPVRRYLRSVMVHRDVFTPLLLALCLGFVYTGSTLLYGGEVHVSLVANSRYRDALPPDNILPRLVAERVVDGIRGEPFIADWLSSDRPPLQAAVETMASPFIPKGSRELNYQALATMLQLLVIPAGWILLRRLGLSFLSTLGVVSATALSGTVAFNGTYVWPKLLCAAYSILAIAALIPLANSDQVATVPSWRAPSPLRFESRLWVLFQPASRIGNPGPSWRAPSPLCFESHQRVHFRPASRIGNPSWTDRLASGLPFSLSSGLLAGTGLGLSFAAHGGALFVMLPIVCVLIIVFGVSVWRSTRLDAVATVKTGPAEIISLGVGVLIVSALLFAPWLGYQRVIAPPGNRLLKWHLAGVVDIDQRSFGKAMIDQYSTPPLREIVANKTSNIRELFNPARFVADIIPALGTDDSIDRVRQREFGHLGNSVSISAVGIGMGLAGWLLRRRRSRELTVGLLGLGSGVLATLVWCLVLYGPKATLPHQGSLAVPLVLIGSSALLAASAHRWMLGAFVALSAYKVTRVWILAGPLSPDRQRSTAALGMLLIGTVAFVIVLLSSIRHDALNSGEQTNPERINPLDHDLLIA